jgi:peptide/nickel transport system permease protein
MTAYIIRRLLMGLLILALVTVIVFLAVRLLPGDPLLMYMAQSSEIMSMTPEQLDILRHEFGLDQPLLVQYFDWIGGIFQGDLGKSIYFREDVAKLLAERFPITLHLGVLSFLLSSVCGIAFGMLAAIRRARWIDTTVTFLSYIGISVPIFWLGLLLMYGFGLRLGLLPIAGYTSPFDNFWLSTKQAIMPVMCLSVQGLAAVARQTRSSVLEVISQDYIRTAWSKGLRERLIVQRHVLKNSLIPVITLLGLIVGMVFGGSVLVETVFAIPGMGRLLVTSTMGQDYTVLQSCTLILAAIIILTNLIVDIAYGWLDPRIRYA